MLNQMVTHTNSFHNVLNIFIYGSCKEKVIFCQKALTFLITFTFLMCYSFNRTGLVVNLCYAMSTCVKFITRVCISIVINSRLSTVLTTWLQYNTI